MVIRDDDFTFREAVVVVRVVIIIIVVIIDVGVFGCFGIVRDGIFIEVEHLTLTTIVIPSIMIIKAAIAEGVVVVIIVIIEQVISIVTVIRIVFEQISRVGGVPPILFGRHRLHEKFIS